MSERVRSYFEPIDNIPTIAHGYPGVKVGVEFDGKIMYHRKITSHFVTLERFAYVPKPLYQFRKDLAKEKARTMSSNLKDYASNSKEK